MKYWNLHVSESERPRVAVVTGGTGTVGAAVCKKLALSGFDVAVQYHQSGGQAEAIVAEVRKSGRHSAAFAWDARSGTPFAHVADQMTGQLGFPELVIHCISPPILFLDWRSSFEEFAKLNAMYSGALIQIAEAYLPEMMHRQSGAIVGMLSEAMLPPYVPGWSAYTAAKLAMASYLAALAQNVSDSGVRIVGIMPGAVRRVAQSSPLPAGDLARAAVARRWPIGIATETVAETIAKVAMEPEGFPNGVIVRVSATDGIKKWQSLDQVLEGKPQSVVGLPEAGSHPIPRETQPESVLPRVQSGDELDGMLGRVFRECFQLGADFPVQDLALGAYLPWDSLKQITLMLEVEDAFGVKFTEADLPSLLSFKGLRNAIASKKGRN